jgi:Raf kinase inhibitor-like YbhB/YbcL family protein
MTLELWSEALEPGGAIPARFTADGENLSPPLRWSNVPTRARELALVLEDLDAGGGQPLVHWIVWRIPTRLDGLPEGFGVPGEPPGMGAEALEGRNALDHVGYDGPEPPDDRAHRYRFRLLALDAPLELGKEPDGAALDHATQGHVVEEAQLVGTYCREEKG